ncbi:hypothetical protein [Hugonella massiliensis]|uniref:hypothetical protein n=1 Tax=Hugonella massiliensis TaxID=1720315 RepID=UPI0012E3D9A2|nr:hypothetical protein [Hugonella massiliensis]
MAQESFEQELDREVDERLALMEEPGYQFPAPLGRIDWVLIAVIPAVSLLLLVVGEFL